MRASEPSAKLWPYGYRQAVLALPLILIALVVFVALLHSAAGWPPAASDGVVLTGILVLSLVPILLVLVDAMVARGGSLEVAGVKINFPIAVAASRSVQIDANIGVQGQPIFDSQSRQILDSMRKAVTNDISVIDLEMGQAWWETRLLVLCAGAVRLRRPSAIVFLATEAEVPRRFQGWARPEVLLPVLLELKPEYRCSYLDAQVASAQWAVVTPPARSANPAVTPPTPPGAILLAQTGASVAPFTDTGQLNEMATEQFLALALGQYEADPVRINIAYLKGTYAAALHTDAIDRAWPAEQQTKAFLGSDAPYLAITVRGQYDALLPRVAGLNSILRAVVERDKSASQA